MPLLMLPLCASASTRPEPKPKRITFDLDDVPDAETVRTQGEKAKEGAEILQECASILSEDRSQVTTASTRAKVAHLESSLKAQQEVAQKMYEYIQSLQPPPESMALDPGTHNTAAMQPADGLQTAGKDD